MKPKSFKKLFIQNLNQWLTIASDDVKHNASIEGWEHSIGYKNALLDIKSLLKDKKFKFSRDAIIEAIVMRLDAETKAEISESRHGHIEALTDLHQSFIEGKL